MWTICTRCSARPLSEESANLCHGAKANKPLVPLPAVPNAYRTMIQKEKQVQQKSRAYNNLFSFNAIGALGEKGFHYPPEGGLSNLIVHGRVYHRMLNGMKRVRTHSEPKFTLIFCLPSKSRKWSTPLDTV